MRKWALIPTTKRRRKLKNIKIIITFIILCRTLHDDANFIALCNQHNQHYYCEHMGIGQMVGVHYNCCHN